MHVQKNIKLYHYGLQYDQYVDQLPDYSGILCGALGWIIALKAERSRVWFQLALLGFFFDLVTPAALWPWDRLSP